MKNHSLLRSGLVRVAAPIAIVLSLGSPALAGTLSGRDIVVKAHCIEFYQGSDSAGRVVLEIVDGQGRKQERELSMVRRDEPGQDCGGKQAFYAFFRRPSDVKEMRFLVAKDPSKDDDRWLYLPSLDLVKRISSADKRTSFAGTHIFYEDVSGRRIDDDTHKLLETTDTYYIVESTPKKKDDVEFSSFKVWIHKDTFVGVKAEFYDKNGRTYRTYDAKKVETIAGYPTVTWLRMSDSKIGGYTDMKITDVKYDSGLPGDIFTERYLRTVPTKYLR